MKNDKKPHGDMENDGVGGRFLTVGQRIRHVRFVLE